MNIFTIIILQLVISTPIIFSLIFVPSLPLIAVYYKITPIQSQYIILLFLLGSLLVQPVCGLLSNNIGRKKTLQYGVYIGLIGTVMSLFSVHIHSYIIFLLSRFIQGFAYGGFINITYTVINDYGKKNLKKNFAYISFIKVMAPAISIFLGGIVQECMSWDSIIPVLLLIGLLLLIFVNRLKEDDKNATSEINFNILTLLSSYLNALKDKSLLLYTILFGCFVAINYMFMTYTPEIFEMRLKISAISYSENYLYLFAFMAISMFLSPIILGKINAVCVIKKSVIIIIILALLLGCIFLNINKVSDMYLVFLFFTLTLILTGGSGPFIFSLIYRNQTNTAIASSLLNMVILVVPILFVMVSHCIKIPYDIKAMTGFCLIAFFLLMLLIAIYFYEE